MPKRTFRNKKGLRKTRRKRNPDELKNAYLMMNVGGKIATYKLKKEKKNFKMHGGMWPFSSPEPTTIPVLTSNESEPIIFGREPTATETIQNGLSNASVTAQNGLASIKDGVIATSEKITNAFKPKEDESIVPTI